jgi:hypothetical protein
MFIKPLKLYKAFKGFGKDTKELNNINSLLGIYKRKIISFKVNKGSKRNLISIL